MDQELKIYGVSTCNRNEYGMAAGVVIAKSKTDAVKLLIDKKWDCCDVTENDLTEVPFKEGEMFIDNYYE